MRKGFSLLLVLILAAFITACGDQDKENNGNDNNANTEQENNNAEENNNDEQDNNAEENNNDAQDNQNDEAAGDAEDSIAAFEDLLSHYEAEGLDVGEPEAGDPEGAEIIHANHVITVKIEGIDVQMYYFEDQDSDEYQEALENNTITIDFEGQEAELSIYVHDGYGILDYEYHVAKDEMVDYLEEF